MAGADGPLRISVSLSGGASLGAYHAGGLAALATALQAEQDDDRGVRLDAIGGASAGAGVDVHRPRAAERPRCG
jgi:predicted acylesterase/phospholipase RssA